MLRRLPLWLLTSILAAAVSAPIVAATGEYDVKAAYLYNFASFATWPASAFDGAAGPLRVCTVGPDMFGPVLADTLRDERIGSHPLVLVTAPPAGELRRCHILFIPARAANSDAILRAVAGAPVLTVGESDSFLRDGGVVRFVVENGRVRFDVNPAAVTTAGVTLNSRLLQVARQVQ